MCYGCFITSAPNFNANNLGNRDQIYPYKSGFPLSDVFRANRRLSNYYLFARRVTNFHMFWRKNQTPSTVKHGGYKQKIFAKKIDTAVNSQVKAS